MRHRLSNYVKSKLVKYEGFLLSDYRKVERFGFPSVECVIDITAYLNKATPDEFDSYVFADLEVQVYHGSLELLKDQLDSAIGHLTTGRVFRGTAREKATTKAFEWVNSEFGLATGDTIRGTINSLNELCVLLKEHPDRTSTTFNGYYYRIARDTLVLLELIRKTL